FQVGLFRPPTQCVIHIAVQDVVRHTEISTAMFSTVQSLSSYLHVRTLGTNYDAIAVRTHVNQELKFCSESSEPDHFQMFILERQVVRWSIVLSVRTDFWLDICNPNEKSVWLCTLLPSREGNSP
ncbi:hypothetical protein CRM22_011265, partial [Opisthorchis felineus]